MKIRSFVIAVPIIACGLLFAVSASANINVNLTATGEGWCSPSFGCNNTSVTGIANTFAGSTSGSIFRDWFAFSIPSGNFGAATISIWNDGNDVTQNSTAVYNLYGASGISLSGLLNGPIIGSIALTAADTGVSQFTNITLNSAGLALLNASSGKTFVFGGDVNGANPSLQVQIFGYTGGSPIAALDLTATPEPSSRGLELIGAVLAFAGWKFRRKFQRS